MPPWKARWLRHRPGFLSPGFFAGIDAPLDHFVKRCYPAPHRTNGFGWKRTEGQLDSPVRLRNAPAEESDPSAVSADCHIEARHYRVGMTACFQASSARWVEAETLFHGSLDRCEAMKRPHKSPHKMCVFMASNVYKVAISTTMLIVDLYRPSSLESGGKPTKNEDPADSRNGSGGGT